MKKASFSLGLIMAYNLLIILVSLTIGMNFFSLPSLTDTGSGQEFDITKKPESLASNKLFWGKTVHLAMSDSK